METEKPLTRAYIGVLVFEVVVILALWVFGRIYL